MGRHHQPLVAHIASVAKGTQSRGRIAVQRASDGLPCCLRCKLDDVTD
jgi:hypothetical protein